MIYFNNNPATLGVIELDRNKLVGLLPPVVLVNLKWGPRAYLRFEIQDFVKKLVICIVIYCHPLSSPVR